MRKLFQYDSQFWVTLSFLSELVVLSVFWLLCSLTIVTMGAATAALDQMLRRRRKEGNVGPVLDFFRFFFRGFFRTTVIWMLYLIGIAWLTISTRMFALYTAFPLWPLALMELSVLLLLLPGIRYALMIRSQNTCTLWEALSRATILGLRELPRAALALLLAVVPAGLMLYLPQTIPFLLTILLLGGVGGTAYLQEMLLYKKFDGEELVC